MLKKGYIIILLLAIASPVFAQIRINFIPEIYGRNVNGLFNCQLINGRQAVTASLTITVTERASGTICVIKTPEFTLQSGTNPVPALAVRQSAIQFSQSKGGRLLSMNNTFPAGEYEYCYSLTIRNSDILPDEECFSYTLAPFAELNLIDPYDGDDLCNKRPVFTWQPLVPALSGTRYQLVLTEIKQGQSATEAINYNQPIINQRNITSPMLVFPSIARDLELNKKYSWQVTAYKDLTVLNRSEVSQFSINCADSVKKQVVASGYRDIEDLSKGNFYIASGYLRFALVNSYGVQNMVYTITSINNPNKKIGHLAKIKLVKGNNQIDIDLAGNSSFTDGEFYILTVTMPTGNVKSLRFLYKEEDSK
ncbi:DUF928 domain-containing protein [Mucilaginibacter auburnensis]|uniref:DUF928 domain-containing protein n=1 Tax=Mucilaginibacter auburnensis TaxID=1457233 RepID=A0A2H9VNU0_9SPHI|nr:DUF928 domain-containing protein [Mucilaginibacter auburnensis]PJJ79987.1 hypothetical protein CLV57_3129 [Mucilaginibacter auburnensis]